jgi:hypothetical protein
MHHLKNYRSLMANKMHSTFEQIAISDQLNQSNPANQPRGLLHRLNRQYSTISYLFIRSLRMTSIMIPGLKPVFEKTLI